ncbi:protein FATTY ACID EXPORT 2, chloroplastic-like [Humulus lupulus]|uniref:protein FATTY ACID EXPORT 2, chloroplastic-like n=1 Tax=Humulus lupulus TaxID=3486 RepID=UPI002B403F21|nr:protein FATTY ACID EXPORT 2, chloroplastic-like [Humulus lupulus]
MAEALFGVSQTFLLLQPKIRFSCLTSGRVPALQSRSFRTSFGGSNLLRAHHHQKLLCTAVVSDPRSSNTFTVDSATKEVDIQLDSGGGDGNGFGDRGDSGGGGGGGGGGDNSNPNEGEGEGESHENSKNKMALSMSQKLTLGYAALVGVGGLMGYLKSGSQKSLLAGGISATLLYYVHTQLPTNPVFASSLGLGLSAALLVVMGSRFKKSGKIFPAGVVSLVSFVMTGGYLHGILRSAH